jgi:hypothetical protein
MSVYKAKQILRRFVYSFPELNAEKDDEDIDAIDVFNRFQELWPEVKAASYFNHDDDAVLVAFQMGYRMAQRDKETFNSFQDEKSIIDSAKMYHDVLYGKPPYSKEEKDVD